MAATRDQTDKFIGDTLVVTGGQNHNGQSECNLPDSPSCFDPRMGCCSKVAICCIVLILNVQAVVKFE